MADSCFDLEDVIIDDASWSGNNIIVRVVEDPQQQESVNDTSTHDLDSLDTETADKEDHGKSETPVRVIDEAAAMDVLEYVDKSKNPNTRSAEKMVRPTV